MDSKVVNLEIRKTIRPFLKERGFTRFAPRYCWRHRENAIDVIHFWSPYNWIYAEVMGITTFSFQIDMGIYFPDIPQRYPDHIKKQSGRLLPKEYESHFRRRLYKSIEQPEHPGAELWYIDPNGDNLEDVINDVRFVIERDALPWFDTYTPETFFDLMRTYKGGDLDIGLVCGGNYMAGYLSKSLGHYEMAIEYLEAFLISEKKKRKSGSTSDDSIQQSVETDIEYMKSQL